MSQIFTNSVGFLQMTQSSEQDSSMLTSEKCMPAAMTLSSWTQAQYVP